MPDVLDPVLDEESDSAPPPSSTPLPEARAETPAPVQAPPRWKDIETDPKFQNFSDTQKSAAFTKWVSDSSGYLQASGTPRKALGAFTDYVNKTSPAYGVGFVFNPDGTPLTVEQEAATRGRPLTSEETTPGTQGATLKDLPWTTPVTPLSDSVGATVGRGTAALKHGLIDLFAKPVAEGVSNVGYGAAKVWDYVTGIHPDTSLLDSLDSGIANRDLNESERVAAEGGLRPEEKVGHFAGHLSEAFGGGFAGMIGVAATQASDDTYHNAIEQGASPKWAAASAGVAATVSAATLGVLKPLNELGIGAILGEKAEAFMAGAYRPSVVEAAKIVGWDAAGLAGTGVVGQVAQNAADAKLYDPARPLTEGAVQVGAKASLFSLIHLPTMTKALWDNRTALQSAKTDVQNTRAVLMSAHADGDPVKIASAEKSANEAEMIFHEMVDKTVQEAPPPTPGDVAEAKAIASPEPAAAPADPLDAMVAATDAEAAKPAELPIAGQVEETAPALEPVTKEPLVPETTAQGVGPMTEQSVKTFDETQTTPEPSSDGQASPQSGETAPAESGRAASAESASVVAGEPQAPALSPEPIDTPHQEALRARIMKVLGKDVPKTAKIVFSEEHENPAWADPNQPGKILVNPDVLGKVLADSDKGFETPENGDLYIKRLMAQKAGEEVIHNAQHALRGAVDHDKIYGELSPEEIKRTEDQYGDEAIHVSKATSPEDASVRRLRFVEEHARQILQRKALGETTEDVWKSGDKPHLVRYLQALYQKIKAHIATFGDNTELQKYLKNIEGVLEDAEKAGQHIPMTDEEIALQNRSRQDAMDERTQGQETLLHAVKSVGGLVTDDPVLRGELQNIKEAKNKGAMLQLFRTKGKSLDKLRDALQERGFHYQTLTDMLDSIHASLRTGKDIYPTNFEGSQVAFASNPQIDTPEFKGFFGDWKRDPKNASKVVDENGKPLVVYGGHGNAEMYGDSYHPGKGTAGGSYWSESPQIASNYALGKIGGAREFFQHGDQYRLADKSGNLTKKISQVELTPEQKAKIDQLASARDENDEHLNGVAEMDRYIEANKAHDKDARRWAMTGGKHNLQNVYDFMESMGDTIAYDRDEAYSGEPRFNRQQNNDFEDLLNHIGIKWNSSDKLQPGVIPAYLNIRNPIDAEKPFPPDLLKALDDVSKYTRPKLGIENETHWTKDYPLKQWVKDIKDGNEFWTTHIPSKALPIIKRFGYDGIRERGMKGVDLPRDQKQINWIVFDRKGQVKSAIANKGQFDPEKASFTAASKPTFDRLGRKENESFKDAELEPPSVLSAAANVKWEQTKKIMGRIANLKNEATKLGKVTDWVRMASRYNTIIGEGVQRSNAIFRELKSRLPDKTISGGVIRWIEAGGDKPTLERWLKITEGNDKTKHLAPYYEAALNLSPEHQAVAQKISAVLESYRNLAKTWGIEIPKRNNYFPREVNKNADSEDDIRSFGHGDTLNVSFKHGKKRKFETMFDGEQGGITYHNNDAATGTASYVLDLMHAVNARKFFASLNEGKSDSGERMVTAGQSSWMEISNPAKGEVHLVMDKRPGENFDHYRRLQGIPAAMNWAYAGELNGKMVMHRTDLLVHPEIAARIENVFGSSKTKSGNLRGWWQSESTTESQRLGKMAARIALHESNAYMKSNLFAGWAVFHPIQLGFEALSRGNSPMLKRAVADATNYFTGRKHGGIEPPNFTNPNVIRASDAGLMLHPEESELADEGGTNIDKTFLRLIEWTAQKTGTNVGEIFTRLKQSNKDTQTWIFQKYIPALKMQYYEGALERNMRLFSKEIGSGEYTPEQIERHTAATTNYAFSHLNYRAIAMHPNLRLASQTLFLAPDFFYARQADLAQTGLGFVGAKSGRESMVAAVRMITAIGVSAQLANYWLNGETDLSHPFEVRIGNRYYGLRTRVGDALALFKDSYAVVSNQKGVGLPYVYNRASPLIRFIGELSTGRNWRGEKIGWTTAITDMIAGSFPMAAQGAISHIPGFDKVFVSSRNNTISPFESALGALGIKVSRYSPIATISQQAHTWAAKNPEKVGMLPNTGQYPVGGYRPLENALDDGNLKSAYQEHLKLVDQMTYLKKVDPVQAVKDGLDKSLHHTFTGSTKGDSAFYDSLNAHDKALFDAAKTRQNLLLDRYNEMLQQNRK